MVAGSEGLAPGAETRPLTIRSQLGYTGSEPREDMLQNSHFVDAKVELFAKYALRAVEARRRVPDRAPSHHQVKTPAGDAAARASLDRRLGPLDASAIVISNVIGVGIFTTPGVVAEMLPSSTAMLAVWAPGRRARVCRRAGVRGAGGAGGRRPAASTSTCARALAGWRLPDRLDVVRRRFQRRDCVRLGRRRRLSGSLHPGCRRCDGHRGLDARSVRLVISNRAPGRDRHHRLAGADPGPRRRPGAAGPEFTHHA